MVSSIQKEKAEMFLEFHQYKEILVLLNSWDIGSSKLIEACSYKAIATTIMGIAASLSYTDCQVIQLSEMIEAKTGIVNGVQNQNLGNPPVRAPSLWWIHDKMTIAIWWESW